jgi:RNA polymerase sigma-70 factor (ECF subfamily)
MLPTPLQLPSSTGAHTSCRLFSWWQGNAMTDADEPERSRAADEPGGVESSAAEFAQLIRRIRDGDGSAAEELVRRYEPLVRRAVRVRLLDHRLRQVFDSMDICQSVLASFFLRTAAGSYDVQAPQDLVRLLVGMARNKLAEAARRQYRQKRDRGRTVGAGDELLEHIATPTFTPSRVIAGRELWQQFLRQMNAEERQLVQLRSEGLAWAEIAARMGGTPQARRVQLARAVRRAAAVLGVDERDE